MKSFNLFIPITKVDEEQRLVYGLATAEVADKSGEVFDYESSLPYYKEWSGEIHKASGGKSYGNVREMHTSIAAGKLTQISFNDEQKQIEVVAKIVNESTWEKVLEGVLTGFSHGGEYIKRWKDPDDAKLTRYTARPAELSVVDNPCLGSATFELLRADGSSEMRKFKTKESPMTETVNDGKPIQPKAEPEQVWKATDGKTFAKKDEWRKYQLELEAQEQANDNPALKMLADLTKAVESKENADHDPMTLGKKEFSDEKRQKLADEGKALPDGSFPIENVQDLENAVQAYGRAKDKEKAKAHIIARAKDLGAEDKLPDDWKKSKKSLSAETLEKLTVLKGYAEAYDAKTAIDALCLLECLIGGEEWEAMMGEGEDDQIANLKEAVSRIKAFIAAEIMEGEEAEKADNGDLAKRGARHSASDKGHLGKAMGYLDEAKDHHEDAVKSHGKVGEMHKAMMECMDKMSGCMKTVKDTLAKEEHGELSEHMDAMEGHLDKAMKHHGKLGKSHDGIAAAHDGIGHALKAVGAMEEDGEAEKAAAAEMKKVTDAQAELQAKLDASEVKNAELTKTLDAYAQQVPSLIERITKLEALPMPGKGVLYQTNATGTAPMTKGHEAQIEPAAPVEVTPSLMHGASPEMMRALLHQR